MSVHTDNKKAPIMEGSAKIGRASCRERVQISVVAVSLKKKKKEEKKEEKKEKKKEKK